MTKKIFYVDAATHERRSIDEEKLDEELAELAKYVEQQVSKLKKINGCTLQSFDISIGISGGILCLTVTGGLSLSFKVD